MNSIWLDTMHQNHMPWDFSGSPVIKTPSFHLEGAQFRNLVNELIFRIPWGVAKNNNNNNKFYCWSNSLNTKGDMGEWIKSDYVLGPHGLYFFFLSKIYGPGLVSLILSHINTLCSISFLLVPSQNRVKININIPPAVVELVAFWNFSWVV